LILGFVGLVERQIEFAQMLVRAELVWLACRAVARDALSAQGDLMSRQIQISGHRRRSLM